MGRIILHVQDAEIAGGSGREFGEALLRVSVGCQPPKLVGQAGTGKELGDGADYCVRLLASAGRQTTVVLL
jgi:hypothetical protein